jgi:hypothetical protein
MFKCDVQYVKEDSWKGRKDHIEKWEAPTKEDLFMKMLVANNRLQKSFDKDKMNGDCWRFTDDDWKLQDEYDAWWRNLGEEKREEIFEKA